MSSVIGSSGLLVDVVIQLVQKNREDDGVDHLRYDDPSQIEKQMDPASDQKCRNILADSVSQVTDADQQQGRLDIIIIEYAITISGKVSDQGVDQSIEAQDPSAEEIKQKACEKPDSHSCLSSAHQGKGSREDNRKIRPDRCDLYIGQQRRLKYGCQYTQDPDCHSAFHSAPPSPAASSPPS